MKKLEAVILWIGSKKLRMTFTTMLVLVILNAGALLLDVNILQGDHHAMVPTILILISVGVLYGFKPSRRLKQ